MRLTSKPREENYDTSHSFSKLIVSVLVVEEGDACCSASATKAERARRSSAAHESVKRREAASWREYRFFPDFIHIMVLISLPRSANWNVVMIFIIFGRVICELLYFMIMLIDVNCAMG